MSFNTIKRLLLYVGLVLGIIIFMPVSVFASGLTNLSDALSRLKTLEPSDHVVQFITSVGVTSGVIQISFNDAISNTNAVDYTDIDLLYGPIGREVQQGVYSAPGTNTWGAAISSVQKTVTFSYPLANATPILPGERVIVIIGKQALHDIPISKQVWKQPLNGMPVSRGHVIDIIAGSASSSVVVPIVSNDVVSLVCQSTLSTPTTLKAENSAGIVKLTWEDAADNENGFTIERNQEITVAVGDTTATRYSSFDQILDLRAQNAIQAADNKIQAGIAYQYRVRAYNTCGLSGYSNVATVKTPPGTVMSLAPAIAPVAPIAEAKPFAPTPTQPKTPIEIPKETPKEKVSATASEKKPPAPAEVQKPLQPVPNISGIRSSSTVNSITLQWQNPPVTDFASVKIQRSTALFPQSVTDGQNVFNGRAETFTDSGLAAGQVYYYTFFTLTKSGGVSSGSFIAVTVKELPQVPVSLPPSSPTTQAAAPQVPIVQEIIPVSPASSGMLPAASAAFGSYSAPVAVGGVPVAPAVIVSIPAEESKVVVKQDEAQRTSAVMQDSSGGTSAFTVDIPSNTFTEEAEVAVTPITAAQTAIIDEDARTPTGYESVGGIVYKIQVKNAKGERVKKFEKPVKLTFQDNDSLIQTINEESLKVYYWESSLKSWIALKSSIDTSSNVIIAEVSHATLFSVFGQQRRDISSEKRRDLIVVSQSTKIFKRPESYLFRTDDLHLTFFDQVRGGWKQLASAGQTFYAVTSSVLDICIPVSFFDKNTDTVTLALADALQSDQYFLAKDSSRQCYATSFVVPKFPGVFNLAIKSKNADDSVRTNSFSLMAASWHEVAIVPPLLRISEYAGTPRIAGLIALLIVIIGFFVFFDVYQKVLKGKRKKS